MQQRSDMEIIAIGLQKYPWDCDRVRNWRLRAEERYIAPQGYDPEATEFPPPWDSVADAPPEAVQALAHTFRNVLGVEDG